MAKVYYHLQGIHAMQIGRFASQIFFNNLMESTHLIKSEIIFRIQWDLLFGQYIMTPNHCIADIMFEWGVKL